MLAERLVDCQTCGSPSEPVVTWRQEVDGQALLATAYECVLGHRRTHWVRVEPDGFRQSLRDEGAEALTRDMLDDIVDRIRRGER